MTPPSPNPVESLRALPELLPCPFCGVVPYNAHLRDCWIRMQRDGVSYEQSELDAAWNRRPASVPDAERYQWLLDDPESGIHLLRLLSLKKGTQDDFRRMQDRIMKSKEDRRAILAKHSTAAEKGHGR